MRCVVAAVLLLFGLFVAGCAGSGSSRSSSAASGLHTFATPTEGSLGPVAAESRPGCTGGQFENDPRQDLVSGKTPQEAVTKYLGFAASRLAASGFPSGGWHLLRRDGASATFKSGRSELHLEEFTDHGWRVISGEQCA
jgi:hypothetical protein